MLSYSYDNLPDQHATIASLWITLAGMGMPEAVAAMGCVAAGLPLAETAHLDAVFVPLPLCDPQAPAKLRAAFGAGIHLVAVVGGHHCLTSAERQMLFASGIDDCLDPDDPADVEACVLRTVASARKQAILRKTIETVTQERDELRASIDNLPSPIFFKDCESVYRGCNRAFGEFFGRRIEDIVGSSVFEILSQRDGRNLQEGRPVTHGGWRTADL